MMYRKISIAIFAVLLTAVSSYAKFPINTLVFNNDGSWAAFSNIESPPDANGIIYVKQGATGDGSSWANATGNLQAAISTPGVSEVWVAKGEYQPALNGSFAMKAFVKIYGGFPNTGTPAMNDRNWRTQETILKGNGAAVINNISIIDDRAVLDGFTITAGSNYSAYGGGGMLNQSSASPTIINCTFKANNASRGGGMANFTNSPTIINCVFLNNVGNSSGGGIYNENAIPIIKSCVFSGNKVTATAGHNGGGGIYNTGTYTLAVISDCLFNANEAEYGSAIRNGFTSNKNQQLVNCTFYNNKPNSGVAAPIYNNNATTTFVNTIFWNNSGTVNVAKQNGADPIFKYCLQQGINLTTDGNLDGTSPLNFPQFVNMGVPAGSDGIFGTADDGLALSRGSKLISMGDNALYGADLTTNKDVAGNARLQKGGIDIGAYESAFAPTPVPDVNGIVYVRENGNGNFFADSWDNATAELADALVAAKSNIAIKEIWAASGTYKPLYSPANNNFGTADGRNNAFLLVNNVKLFGGFPATGTPLFTERNPTANPTVLSGDLNNNNTTDNGDVYHVMISSGTVGTAVVDGFTIKNGFGVSATTNVVNGQVVNNNAGGGLIVYNGSPTLNHCIFEANIAGIYGGAMANYSASPVLSNIIFRNNESQSGGAIFNEQNSSPTIFNSLFHDNDANYGVDIQNYDLNTAFDTAPLIYNCTFYGNKTNSKIYNDGDRVKPKIYNCILWGNDAPIENVNSWDVGNGVAVTTVANSLVQGGFAGVNNLSADPLFTNETSKVFTLKVGSPAINAGNNAWYVSLIASTTDLAGNPRLEGANIDMGAYESPATLPVTFGEFTLAKQSWGVKLQWQTLSETNNKEFIIRRSVDGKSFTEMARVASKGNSNSLSSYAYDDNAPFNGLNYYQLQQIDIDGTLTTLGYQTTNFTLSELGLIAYPNPVIDVVHVSLGNKVFREARLLNSYGQAMMSKRIAEEEELLRFEVSSLPKGLYFIELTGDTKESLKLIKN